MSMIYFVCLFVLVRPVTLTLHFTHRRCVHVCVCVYVNYPPHIVSSPEALKIAVDNCLQLSSVGDCSAGKYGPIGEWDVSRVTDMTKMFYQARSFNMDISNWNVSRVTNMHGMFAYAKSFNQDLSKWDVSRVTNMDVMFAYANSFRQTLCGAAWVNSSPQGEGNGVA